MATEDLDLLLANPREFAPVLDDGISSDAAITGPKPKKDETQNRRARARDRSNLAVQRWGIVVPEGKDGDALLSAMRPLIEFRAEEQGKKPVEFRVRPNLDRKGTKDWLFNVYENPDIYEEDRPLYLCLLGGPEQASLEFQQSVAHSTFIGRVHFDKPDGSIDVEGYAEYAKKVVHYARNGFTTQAPELLYYVARDGTRATRNAVPKLVVPSVDTSNRAVQRGKLNANVRELQADSVSRLLAAQAAVPGGIARPSVMLSVSHGLGGNEDDYGSADAQRRRQGALVLGPKEVLDAEVLAKNAFLPGGMWLCFACFGAGTPTTSEYFNWLSELSRLGAYRDSAQIVLQSLALSGKGFIASLPQAALRNPNGPLAVIGHIDLAWNFSYVDLENPSENRSAKFTRALHAMAMGERMGVAHDEITEWFRVTNFSLSSMYEASDDARINNRPDPIDPAKRGPLWLLRNDLRGYVLLGDPAVRLPQAEPAPKVVETKSIPEVHSAPADAGVGPDEPDASPPAMAPDAGDEPDLPAPAPMPAEAGDVPDVETPKDAAIRALADGNETPRAIAERAGCTLEELFDWFVTQRINSQKSPG